MMKVEKELAIIELEATSKEEALQLLGSKLIEQGYVKENFIESILEREKNYPTGLPTEPFGVAIPHTDGDMIHTSTIAFASLKNPVKFLMMGTDDKLVEVKLIFMLALKSPDDQLEMLQKLMELIQDPEMVSKLVQIKSVDELNGLVGDKV
ncbi:PTS sugar transporter subunit IIA [Planococcus sp. SE5232]|uniref:PTS sugar transporter subunit IIA n=1 Tax=unclassified Planococcus (in: firmicutes) TaxID=2662419 RepID=UPI003D6BBA4B